MDHVSEAIRPVDAPTARADPPAIPDIVTRTITGAVAAVVALPALAIAGAPVHASVVQLFVAVALAGVAFVAAAAFASARFAALPGVAVVSVSAWLLAQVSFPAAACVVAPALGFGTGMIAGVRDYRRPDRSAAIGLVAVVVVAGALVALRAVDRDTVMAAGAAVAAVSALAAMLR